MPIVERLDAEPVTPEQQSPRRRLPDTERVHAVELLQKLRTFVFVEVHEHLAVRARSEAMTRGHELSAQLAIVEYFTIADRVHRSRFVCDRLLAPRHVYDGESAHADEGVRVAMRALSVRPAVGDGLPHAAQPFGVELDSVP